MDCLVGQSFWETATLDAMKDELSRANKARDEAYAKLRMAEQEAEKAHEYARLTEQRMKSNFGDVPAFVTIQKT